jgi:hypothetical protein
MAAHNSSTIEALWPSRVVSVGTDELFHSRQRRNVPPFRQMRPIAPIARYWQGAAIGS